MSKAKANRPKVAARAGSKKAAAKKTKPKDKSQRAKAIGKARAEVAANLAAIDAQAPDAATTGVTAQAGAEAAPTSPDATNAAVAARGAKGKKAEGAKPGKAGSKRGAGKAIGANAKPTKAKRISALDAAATVLAASDVPMRAKEMIAAMETKGLWKSPGGQTPEATLYAAIIREISKKGKDARFEKVDRGRFKLRAGKKGA